MQPLLGLLGRAGGQEVLQRRKRKVAASEVTGEHLHRGASGGQPSRGLKLRPDLRHARTVKAASWGGSGVKGTGKEKGRKRESTEKIKARSKGHGERHRAPHRCPGHFFTRSQLSPKKSPKEVKAPRNIKAEWPLPQQATATPKPAPPSPLF